MEANCKITSVVIDEKLLYICLLQSSITEHGTIIKSIQLVEPHELDRTDNDFNMFIAQQIVVNYLPRGLIAILPNLTCLSISRCGLKKLTRNDLVGLDSLEILDFSKNDLEMLPNDLFIGMKKLRRINFSRNKFGKLSSKLLEPIVRTLEHANFTENPSINFRFVKGTEDTLAKLMNVIDTKCKATIAMRHYNVEQEDLHWTTLFETGDFSDFQIKVDQEVFKVHKAILAKSSVLKRMLEIEMTEKRTSELVIKDFSFGAVNDFLNFLYTGVVRDVENAMEMFVLASTYDVQPLLSICKEIMLNDLDGSNALEIFNLGFLYSCDDLKRAAFEEIGNFSDSSLNQRIYDEPEAVTDIVEAKRKLDLLKERFCKEET